MKDVGVISGDDPGAVLITSVKLPFACLDESVAQRSCNLSKCYPQLAFHTLFPFHSFVEDEILSDASGTHHSSCIVCKQMQWCHGLWNTHLASLNWSEKS